ncbi:helix-turn-helix domain-containing protein [Haloarchaeobius sp. TZWWS8]|uniref:helix-turn-helix domain-containing protein n=1 Tax=Haloarchaeobius sp. TZWWS8 TaxID=3446121 RepID=UPI003EC01D1B
MTVSIAVTVPVESVIPGHNRFVEPEQSAEFERVVSCGPGEMTTLWVSGPEHSRVPEPLEAHPGIERVTSLEQYEDSSLYELSFSETSGPVALAIKETAVQVLRSETVDESLLLTLRFRSHEDLEEFIQTLREDSIAFELAWKGDSEITQDGGVDRLTQRQRRTLWLAYERGYFDIPRRATLAELADELDVSSQAVSERLRRALKGHLAGTLSKN